MVARLRSLVLRGFGCMACRPLSHGFPSERPDLRRTSAAGETGSLGNLPRRGGRCGGRNETSLGSRDDRCCVTGLLCLSTSGVGFVDERGQSTRWRVGLLLPDKSWESLCPPWIAIGEGCPLTSVAPLRIATATTSLLHATCRLLRVLQLLSAAGPGALARTVSVDAAPRRHFLWRSRSSSSRVRRTVRTLLIRTNSCSL